MFNCFDHGGAGGGFENTWGTGKLMFSAFRTKMVRIHNRPAYNSECHASRDMGVGELNNSYEDAEVADTIVAVGTNAYETQTNYFLAHWIPNLTGASVDKKKQWFPGEPAERAKLIVVDPRRTVTVSVAEQAAGKENVLHLDIEPGTDVALFNGLLTYAVEQGWHDEAFIAEHTTGFDAALQANRMSLAAHEVVGEVHGPARHRQGRLPHRGGHRQHHQGALRGRLTRSSPSPLPDRRPPGRRWRSPPSRRTRSDP